jgi:hypothetical protein
VLERTRLLKIEIQASRDQSHKTQNREITATPFEIAAMAVITTKIVPQAISRFIVMFN